MAAVPIPVSVRDLFGNEGVGGLRIGDAQQGLGEAHQDDALFARKSVLAHEGVDAAMLGLICAGVLHEAAGDLGRAAALVLGVDGALDETAHEAMFIDQMVGCDFVDRRQAAERQPGCASRCRSACLRCLAYCDHGLVRSSSRQFDFRY